jgi:hypothetical protein
VNGKPETVNRALFEPYRFQKVLNARSLAGSENLHDVVAGFAGINNQSAVKSLATRAKLD